MSEIEKSETRPLGRPCVVCTHASRADIEAELLDGSGLSRLSRAHLVSRHSLARHRDYHLDATAADLTEAGLSAEAIVVRLVTVGDRLRDLAQDAIDAGRIPDAVRALDGERRALSDLARIGIDDETIASRLELGDLLVKAVRRSAAIDPQTALRIAEQMVLLDGGEYAEQIRNLISRNERKAVAS